MFQFNCSLGNPKEDEDVCWSIRNVKTINESFYNMRCPFVYNRSLFDNFNHNSIADIFDAILDVVSLGKSK